MPDSGSSTPIPDCSDVLREMNYDRYLAALYVPEAVRSAIIAIDAFDAEIAAIPKRVTEPTAGEIRLQWWREALNGERPGEAAAHPLAKAMLAVIEKHSLSPEVFEQYLDARVFDFYQDPMPDMAMLEGYCGETSALLYQLKVQCISAKLANECADLCGYAGMVSGLTRIINDDAGQAAHHASVATKVCTFVCQLG